MKKKPLNYYLRLVYPFVAIRKGNNWEVWHSEFGRCAISGHGRTLNAAIRMLYKERRFFIRHLYEHDVPIPEPEADLFEKYSGQFVLRVPKELHARLARDAKSNDVSMNAYITYLLALNKGTMVNHSLIDDLKKHSQSEVSPSPVENTRIWSETKSSIVRHVVVHINQSEIEFPREGHTSQQVNNIPITVENAVANAA